LATGHYTIDWIAIWKFDQDAILKNFTDRLDPNATRGWSDFLTCLSAKIDKKTLRILQLDWENLLVEINDCLTAMNQVTRSRFAELIKTYHRLWQANDMNRQEFEATISELYHLLGDQCGSGVLERFKHMTDVFVKLHHRLGNECWQRSQLKTRDPLIHAAFTRFCEDHFI
jgi:hypothetical protein